MVANKLLRGQLIKEKKILKGKKTHFEIRKFLTTKEKQGSL